MERVALKIQRRRHASPAVFETFIHLHIRERTGPSDDIVHLHEAFLHDGHVCMVFEQHGRSLQQVIERGPLTPPRARAVTRQILRALERLHRCGYAHTDVKPENILYRVRDGSARLADLGSADKELSRGSQPGTREYLAPEVLLGAPLAPNLDLWCLACTVFEILTGHILFQPRAAARKKYREFSFGKDFLETPLAESEKLDQKIEKKEQMSAGDLVAKKYRLCRRLGDGGFATVWLAEKISNRKLDGSYDTLWGFAQEQTAKRSKERTEQEQKDRDWRRSKGADDMLDLALNYEHLLLIEGLAGPIPKSMIEAGRYRASYFEADGAFRFQPRIARRSLRDRLRRLTTLRGEELGEVTDLLKSLLTVDPARRPSAAEALTHPWLLREG